MNILEWLKSDNHNQICIYNPDYDSVKRNLNNYRTNAMNVFGAIIANTGGICFENTVRIFGSTNDADKRDIYLWNRSYGNDNIILIGDDIYGGIYAINIKLKNLIKGNICYFAPDTLMWEDLNVSLKNFIAYLKLEDISKLYPQIDSSQYDLFKNLNVNYNDVISFYPPQWSKEFKENGYKFNLINVAEYYNNINL